MNAFFLVNKPHGISSFDVIRELRKKLGIRKMGHTGTLDPLATGCLLVATGNYTKLIPYLEKASKTYKTTISLDGTTSSYDLAEEIIPLGGDASEKAKKHITTDFIEKILSENFNGKVNQTPPRFSAVKVDGKRAYSLARKGAEFELKQKKIEVHKSEILLYSYPELELNLEVSAGTYIRSIARDIGSLLNTGGYLTKLERTAIEHLNICDACELNLITVNNSIDLQKIFPSDRFIIKDKGLESYGNGMLSGDDIKRLNNGLPRIRKFDLNKKTPYFLYNGKEITHVLEYDGVELAPIRKV